MATPVRSLTAPMVSSSVMRHHSSTSSEVHILRGARRYAAVAPYTLLRESRGPVANRTPAPAPRTPARGAAPAPGPGPPSTTDWPRPGRGRRRRGSVVVVVVGSVVVVGGSVVVVVVGSVVVVVVGSVVVVGRLGGGGRRRLGGRRRRLGGGGRRLGGRRRRLGGGGRRRLGGRRRRLGGGGRRLGGGRRSARWWWSSARWWWWSSARWSSSAARWWWSSSAARWWWSSLVDRGRRWLGRSWSSLARSWWSSSARSVVVVVLGRRGRSEGTERDGGHDRRVERRGDHTVVVGQAVDRGAIASTGTTARPSPAPARSCRRRRFRTSRSTTHATTVPAASTHSNTSPDWPAAKPAPLTSTSAPLGRPALGVTVSPPALAVSCMYPTSAGHRHDDRHSATRRGRHARRLGVVLREPAGERRHLSPRRTVSTGPAVASGS